MKLGKTLGALSSVFALVALAGACSAPADEVAGTSVSEREVTGELSYELDGTALDGSFRTSRGDVEFSALVKDDRLYDVTVELNGVVLSLLMASDVQAADFDGFTAGTGDPTQLRSEDRLLLAAFRRAVAGSEEIAASNAGKVLEHAVSLWSEMSDTYSLVRAAHGDEDKAYQSLCGLCHQYAQATHDCWTCSDYQAGCTSNVQLGERGAATNYWVNGAWTTQGQDHVPGLWETGECFGNCGEGCPGDYQQQLTQDCANHDQCVRNGHWIVSGWCDDDFTLAIDDELYAPTCVSTGGQVIDTKYVACTDMRYLGKLGWVGRCICPAGYSLTAIGGAGGTCKKTAPLVYCP
jgi:hypothetical protein